MRLVEFTTPLILLRNWRAQDGFYRAARRDSELLILGAPHQGFRVWIESETATDAPPVDFLVNKQASFRWGGTGEEFFVEVTREEATSGRVLIDVRPGARRGNFLLKRARVEALPSTDSLP